MQGRGNHGLPHCPQQGGHAKKETSLVDVDHLTCSILCAKAHELAQPRHPPVPLASSHAEHDLFLSSQLAHNGLHVALMLLNAEN
jgi:hypothetical protein